MKKLLTISLLTLTISTGAIALDQGPTIQEIEQSIYAKYGKEKGCYVDTAYIAMFSALLAPSDPTTPPAGIEARKIYDQCNIKIQSPKKRDVAMFNCMIDGILNPKNPFLYDTTIVVCGPINHSKDWYKVESNPAKID